MSHVGAVVTCHMCRRRRRRRCGSGGVEFFFFFFFFFMIPPPARYTPAQPPPDDASYFAASMHECRRNASEHIHQHAPCIHSSQLRAGGWFRLGSGFWLRVLVEGLGAGFVQGLGFVLSFGNSQQNIPMALLFMYM